MNADGRLSSLGSLDRSVFTLDSQNVAAGGFNKLC